MAKVTAETAENLKRWWLGEVAEHDYDAALNYLTLKFDAPSARGLITHLRKADVTLRRPNDILRAASLPALPMSDPGVHRDLMRLLTGNKLSPVLVVTTKEGAEIADGYHRVSLMYAINPFQEMPLKIG